TPLVHIDILLAVEVHPCAPRRYGVSAQLPHARQEIRRPRRNGPLSREHNSCPGRAFLIIFADEANIDIARGSNKKLAANTTPTAAVEPLAGCNILDLALTAGII